MTDHAALIERLEKATGPDDEIGVAVLCALLAPEGSKIERSRFNGRWCIFEPATFGKEPFRLWNTPEPWRQDGFNPTASLDAAIALVKRVRPGRTMACDATAPECGIDWELFEPKRIVDGARRVKGTASTHAIALLLALFKSLNKDRAIKEDGNG